MKYGEKVLVTCETYYGIYRRSFTSLLRLQRKLDLDISNADLALLKRQRSILKMADTPLHGASAGIRREE